jgi:hypothetical protein
VLVGVARLLAFLVNPAQVGGGGAEGQLRIADRPIT